MTIRVDASRPTQLKVTFSWEHAAPAGPISVVGSFNDWTPGLDELFPDEHGRRSVTIGLPYDEDFVFRYLGGDGQWLDEPDADDISAEGCLLRAVPSPPSQ